MTPVSPETDVSTMLQKIALMEQQAARDKALMEQQAAREKAALEAKLAAMEAQLRADDAAPKPAAPAAAAPQPAAAAAAAPQPAAVMRPKELSPTTIAFLKNHKLNLTNTQWM